MGICIWNCGGHDSNGPLAQSQNACCMSNTDGSRRVKTPSRLCGRSSRSADVSSDDNFHLVFLSMADMIRRVGPVTECVVDLLVVVNNPVATRKGQRHCGSLSA